MRRPTPSNSVPMRRVGLIGRFGSGNIGNDATLEGLLAHLRTGSAPVALDCLCTDPDAVTATYNMPATQMHALSDSRPVIGRLRRVRTAARIVAAGLGDAARAARWVRRHDTVVVVGTGCFETTVLKRAWEGPWVLACIGVAARIFRVPLLLVAVGVSPVDDRPTRALLLTAVRAATWVAPRDAYSCDALTAMGIATFPEAVVPDLAYLNPVLSTVTRCATKPVVAVGAIDWCGSETDPVRVQGLREHYVTTMSQFVALLARRGYTVHLYIGDTGDGGVAEEIARRVPGTHYRAVTSAGEVVAQLAHVDIVVASRYHNVLLALAMGLPTMSVGYGGKHDDLMRAHGVGEYSLSLRDVTPEQLTERFFALEAERSAASRRIGAATDAIRARLMDGLARLDSFTWPVAVPATAVGATPIGGVEHESA